MTVVLEDDGTVIDSDAFFKKLPAQTVLVFLKKGEKWGGGKYNVCLSHAVLNLRGF